MENRLYALMAAAEEQQKVSEQAAQALDGKLKELDERVKTLEHLGNEIARVLNVWHEEFGQKVSEATKETLKREIVGDIKGLSRRLETPLIEAKRASYMSIAAAFVAMGTAGLALWHALG